MTKYDGTLPSNLFMDLDFSGPMPLYFQVAQRIESLIASGELPPGAKLENEVALGERLNLSRPTIRRAIQELVDKGLLVRRRGIGTQVVHGKVTRGLELTSLHEALTTSGQKPTTKILKLSQITADSKLSEHLGVKRGAPILFLRRLRFAKDAPISILENYLPEEYLDLTAEILTEHGLYQVLRSRGVIMKVAKQSIGARKATIPESKLFGLPAGSALLTMDRTAYDNSGQAVEYGNHCYRPDLFSFDFTIVDR